MESSSAWAAMTLVVLVGTWVSFTLVERSWRSGTRWRAPLLLMTGSCAGLLVLVGLLRVPAIAAGDAAVVASLAELRGDSVERLFTVVTTLGDVGPTFVMAGVIGALHLRHTGHRWHWMLPSLLLSAELVLQFWITSWQGGMQIDEFAPELVSGGVGSLPSGSVARLTGLWLLAGLMWRHRPPVSRCLISVGIVLVIIQAVTRLTLARHMQCDILAGLLLGVFLAAAGSLLVRDATQLSPSTRADATRRR